MAGVTAALADVLLEILFPTRCAGCDLPGALLCERCRQELPRIDPTTACPHCSAPYGRLVCTECWDTDLGLDGAVALGVLDRPLSRCVTIYKDSHERRLADVLGELLAREIVAKWGVVSDVREDDTPPVADAVVPVPTSAKAIRKRGYDHTLLLAQSISHHLEIPCLTPLAHVRSADQRRLSRGERLANMSGAFTRPPGHPPIPDRVLLVDDVMTTGATLGAAAALLREGGAREVRAGFLARAW